MPTVERDTKSMTIRIRPYKPTDKDFVLSLVGRFSEFELPVWRKMDDVDSTNRVSLEQAMKQPEPDSAIFVAEEESGALAGFIHLQTQTDYFNDEQHGYISDLAVDKSFEGRGIGRLLLETAEDWARGKGYHLLTLYVFAGNTRAQRMYEKRGFIQEVIKYGKLIK
jgi:ribosomal protein S18 acetylase RimI-like enzyme